MLPALAAAGAGDDKALAVVAQVATSVVFRLAYQAAARNTAVAPLPANTIRGELVPAAPEVPVLADVQQLGPHTWEVVVPVVKRVRGSARRAERASDKWMRRYARRKAQRANRYTLTLEGDSTT